MESPNNYQELLRSLPISSITIWSSHVLNSLISFNDSHQTFPSSLSTTWNDTTWYVILMHYISNINPIVFFVWKYTFKILETNLKTFVQRFAKYCSHFTMIQQFMPKMYYIGYIYPSKFIWQKDIIFPNSRIVQLLSYTRQFFSKLQRKAS